VPEKSIPEQDPVVTKSYAAHYAIAMVILMASMFWALWDEAFGQRPWKTFQQEWQKRYIALLKDTKSRSTQSEKDVARSPEYQQLEQAYKQASDAAKARRDELQKQITGLNAHIQKVQDKFTDRRARINALTYELETEASASGKKSKQKDIDKRKAEISSIEYPENHVERYN